MIRELKYKYYTGKANSEYLPHGKGTLYNHDGVTIDYVGDFENGVKQGKGIEYNPSPNIETIEGHIENDEFFEGCIQYVGGNVYTGGLNIETNNTGKLVLKNGIIIFGTFILNSEPILIGGDIIKPNGTRYKVDGGDTFYYLHNKEHPIRYKLSVSSIDEILNSSIFLSHVSNFGIETGTYTGSIQIQEEKGIELLTGELIYPNGDVFQGEFLYRRPFKGILTYLDKTYYEGDFFDGKPKVIAIDAKMIYCTKVSKTVARLYYDLERTNLAYQGDSKENEYFPHGKGKFFYPNLGHFDGEFIDGKQVPIKCWGVDIYPVKCYNRTIFFSDPEHRDKVYEGQVSSLNVPHGLGTYFINAETKFIGNFAAEIPSKGTLYHFNSEINTVTGPTITFIYRSVPCIFGNGNILYRNGDTFDGEIRYNYPGTGKMTYKNGNTFEGEFRTIGNTVKPWKGKLTVADNIVFDGDLDTSGYFFGRVSRKGAQEMSIQTKYNFEDLRLILRSLVCNVINYSTEGGNFSGIITMNLITGEVWINSGTITYPDGSSYTGEFSLGKFEGKGTMKVFGNMEINGIFKEGKLIELKK